MSVVEALLAFTFLVPSANEASRGVSFGTVCCWSRGFKRPWSSCCCGPCETGLGE